ncbi:hypothetical protein CEXT_79441 [Caerostris extrusa]|uniref:Uncharacterized protein n=1 Tax=Caerostris extrusa TaxID=172846 RepID=A0AAV4VER7_CAEEX|nr:hypothetical protein CEXT_79441 [Caerostris extrusa]
MVFVYSTRPALFPSGTPIYITHVAKGETLELAKDAQPISNPHGDSSSEKDQEIYSLIDQHGLCLFCKALDVQLVITLSPTKEKGGLFITPAAELEIVSFLLESVDDTFYSCALTERFNDDFKNVYDRLVSVVSGRFYYWN